MDILQRSVPKKSEKNLKITFAMRGLYLGNGAYGESKLMIEFSISI